MRLTMHTRLKQHLRDNLNSFSPSGFVIYDSMADSFWLDPEDTYGPAIIHYDHQKRSSELMECFIRNELYDCNVDELAYYIVPVVEVYPNFEVNFLHSINLGDVLEGFEP